MSSRCELPDGWEARVDNRSGKTYFLNHLTKTTTWDDPRPLPYGWEKKQDARTKKIYFVDHNRKTTSWDDPRPALRPGQFKKPQRQIREEKRQEQFRESIDEKQMSNSEIYEGILQMALADDRVSVPELRLLEELQQTLNIDATKHEHALRKIGISATVWEQMKTRGADTTIMESGESGDRSECIICLDLPSDHVVLDCMHLCLCGECSITIMESTRVCPMCRKPAKEIRKVYT